MGDARLVIPRGAVGGVQGLGLEGGDFDVTAGECSDDETKCPEEWDGRPCRRLPWGWRLGFRGTLWKRRTGDG